MAWADWMVVNLSLEDELQLEREARAILHHDDPEDIARLCFQLVKQTHYQQKLLSQAVGRITELEAEGFLRESLEVEQGRHMNWWRRLLFSN